jgi:uncharacterized protein YdaU (DUF1376 family)
VKKDARALDWLPFHVVDWLTSPFVTCLSLAAQGAYIRLLAIQWRDGYIPSDPAKIARFCACSPSEFAPIWEELKEKFDPVDGGLANSRLERDRTNMDELRLKRAEASRKGHAARWGAHNKPMPNACQPHNKPVPTALQNDAEKEKEKEKHISSSPDDSESSPNGWELFITTYPKRPGRNQSAAKPIYERIIKKVDPEVVIEGAKSYASYCLRERKEPQYIKMMPTWLNQKGWEDDYGEVRKSEFDGLQGLDIEHMRRLVS